MPGKFLLMALISGIVLLTACSDGSDVEPKRKFISFKLDSSVMLSEQRSKAYYAPGDATDTDPDNDYSQLMLAGYSYKKDVINIRVFSEESQITPGVYSNTLGGTAMFVDVVETGDKLIADESYGNITVIIHQMHDSIAVGQFSGNLVSMNDGSIKAVKDGYFKLVYKKLQ